MLVVSVMSITVSWPSEAQTVQQRAERTRRLTPVFRAWPSTQRGDESGCIGRREGVKGVNGIDFFGGVEGDDSDGSGRGGRGWESAFCGIEKVDD